MLWKDTSILLWLAGCNNAVWYCITASWPQIYAGVYGWSTLAIGLAYLPSAVASIIAGFVSGPWMKARYRRTAREEGLTADSHQVDGFPIERARIRGQWPVFAATHLGIGALGWAIHQEAHPGILLPLQAVIAFLQALLFFAFNTLLVDVHPDQPSTASAAASLVRSGLSDIGVAVLQSTADYLTLGSLDKIKIRTPLQPSASASTSAFPDPSSRIPTATSMTEQSGIDILCDVAGSDLLLGSMFAAPSPQHPSQSAKRVKLSSDASAAASHSRSSDETLAIADLLTRHETTHDRDDGGKGRPIIRRSDRAAEACLNCASSKAKCDDQKPCGRCKSKNLSCHTSTKRPSTYRTSIDGQSTVSSSDYSPNQTGFGLETNRMTTYDMDREMSIVAGNDHLAVNDNVVQKPYLADPLTHSVPIERIADDMVYFNPTHNFFQDMDFTSWDLNFDGFQVPQFEVNGPSPQSSTASASRLACIARDPSRGHAAFKRSPWLWEPKSKDYVGRDKEGLALNEDKIPQSPAYDKILATHSHRLKVELVIRDRLFAMVLAQNKDPLRIPSFPSLEILNYLLQTHFVQDEYQADSWIHSASFHPSEAMPELLAAIISSGATLIATPAVWQFGLALQEVVRIGMAVRFESSNSFTRDLQCLQALMLVLDIGSWSGFKRKMELAESFLQPLMTMLRRAGTFSAPADSPSLIPHALDPPEVLNTKWRNFIQRESYKRLVIHLFVHDIQSSVGLQKNPLMSFTELCFSLPAARDLWKAHNAEAWRELYLRKTPVPSDMNLPRVSEVMHCMNLLDVFEDYVDVELCHTALMYGYWGQIAAYREAVKFYRHDAAPTNQRGSINRLWLTSQHQELYRDLGEFFTLLCSSPQATPHLTIVTELFMMILHVSPDELQRFAGKSGEEEARLAAISLEDEWAQSREARHAVWHAGQVFRNARLLPPASLRGFNAIAVYFASLTLWVYGLLSCSRSTAHAQEDANMRVPPTYALMDGHEDRDTRAFLQLDKGVPGLSLNGDPVAGAESLSNPGMVLNISRSLFRDSYPVRTEPLPPLVESLGNLLRDLGSGPACHASRVPSRTASEDRP
ncbi:Uu.00g111450.m01.CDS01 [Anthostomella pinea]|uniref:Uu.00g111450.m01.CDS01 n=1 Tax=Anthostomella pinea TaxID=933095 RepID=A0AAI8YGH8_9PEZI|nr:Uu.00g111450.m01.CDS01 [Anthostomella pinea]